MPKIGSAAIGPFQGMFDHNTLTFTCVRRGHPHRTADIVQE
jgi:hypothetical protein